MPTDNEFYSFRRKTHQKLAELQQMVEDQQCTLSSLVEYMIEQKEREAESSDEGSFIIHSDPEPEHEPSSYCTIS